MKKIVLLIFLVVMLSNFAVAGEVNGYQDIIEKDKVETYGDDPDPEKNRIIVFSTIIDWNEQKVKVKGETKIKIDEKTSGEEIKDLYTSMRYICARKAATAIDSINIDCQYTIKDFKAKDQEFTVKLEKFLSDVTTYDFDKDYKTKGIISCAMTVSLIGKSSITGLCVEEYMPNYFNFNIHIPNIFYQELYAEDNVTGVIIDARGSNINPAIFPKIVTNKKDVYNPKTIDKKTLVENGAVQYAVIGSKVDEKIIKKESVKQELAALKRTGNNPVIIKASSANGPLKTDAVISEKDVALIKNSKALKDGKVTIIVDSRVGGIIGKKLNDYDILLVNGLLK